MLSLGLKLAFLALAIPGFATLWMAVMADVGATLLVSRPDLPTMPVVIYRALGQPGLLNYGQALAMSTILMAVAALGLIATNTSSIRM